jgi:glycosyltransferase involved in cell wall biosynthesis
MVNPSISLITPSFNQGEYIEQTIQSVLSQPVENIEYVVVDGGSTDNTLSILKKYSRDIRWISEKDRGQSHAINKGIHMTTGDIIGWINSDDYLLPGALQTVQKLWATKKHAVWCTADSILVNEDQAGLNKYIQKYKSILRKFTPSVYLGITNGIYQQSTFFSRKSIDSVGLLNESLDYSMDYDLWNRLSQLDKPVLINHPLSAFRQHRDSKGWTHFTRQFEETHEVCQKYHSQQIVLLNKIHNALITKIYSLIRT